MGRLRHPITPEKVINQRGLFMDIFFKRRSIRKYTDKPVGNEILVELIKAAMSAPSAGNQQPWQFIIINDRKVLDEIPNCHPHSQMIKQAPAAILICGDENLEVHKGYWVQDCSAATQNLLLAIEAQGLGGVWLGVHPREDRVQKISALLGLPEHVIPFSLIPVGYSAEHLPPSDRYDEAKVRYNHW